VICFQPFIKILSTQVLQAQDQVPSANSSLKTEGRRWKTDWHLRYTQVYWHPWPFQMQATTIASTTS